MGETARKKTGMIFSFCVHKTAISYAEIKHYINEEDKRYFSLPVKQWKSKKN